MSLTDAEIAASANILGQGINALSTSSTNRATRKWNEKMYERQRSDALADWEMQNVYNSPAEQMRRLKAGGLNPNLVYGNGATQASSTVRSAEAQSYKPAAPQVDLGAVFMSFYELLKTQAETNNLEKQKDLMEQELVNKGIQGETSAFDLRMKEQLEGISLEFKRQQLKKLEADTMYTLDQNERATALAAGTLHKAVEEILTMRLNRTKTQGDYDKILAEIRHLNVDTELKEEDLKLKRMGIQPHDKLWQRKLVEWLESHSIPNVVDKVVGKVKRGYGELKKGVKMYTDIFGYVKPW